MQKKIKMTAKYSQNGQTLKIISITARFHHSFVMQEFKVSWTMYQ
jgi:hypothetical protein